MGAQVDNKSTSENTKRKGTSSAGYRYIGEGDDFGPLAGIGDTYYGEYLRSANLRNRILGGKKYAAWQAGKSTRRNPARSPGWAPIGPYDYASIIRWYAEHPIRQTKPDGSSGGTSNPPVVVEGETPSTGGGTTTPPSVDGSGGTGPTPPGKRAPMDAAKTPPPTTTPTTPPTTNYSAYSVEAPPVTANSQNPIVDPVDGGGGGGGGTGPNRRAPGGGGGTVVGGRGGSSEPPPSGIQRKVPTRGSQAVPVYRRFGEEGYTGEEVDPEGGLLGKFEEWLNSQGYDPATLAAMRQEYMGAARGAGDTARRIIDRTTRNTGNTAGYLGAIAEVGQGQAAAVADAARRSVMENYAERMRQQQAGAGGLMSLYGVTDADIANYLAGASNIFGQRRGVQTEDDYTGQGIGSSMGGSFGINLASFLKP